ncbi:polyprenyl synthetase family protein [Paenibacillus athensensis]|uniref:Polyprenyl synthetase n=1 Tax=Paenibacillus athensensis TaxID=1967502 RepID=A0A4Y8Q5D5_9BACL|nr:polyprenyl synthetase family protein [Paenibacillus athensensis]MCD1259251.1 polyprenyl synthetase family protein [Paenibacillus athensensis]
MNPTIVQLMLELMENRFSEPSLSAHLASFIREKAREDSRWADITRFTHYLLGGSDPHIERLAALTEVIVLALDIVDDLQDQDNTGKPWMTCPPALALNAAVALLVTALSELATLPAQADMLGRSAAGPIAAVLPAVGVGAHLSRALCGQQKDLLDRADSESAYLDMTREKSGSLIRLACFLGSATSGCADAATLQALEQFAELFGVAAQIANDLQDLRRYDLKNDLLARKRTLPILFLLQESKTQCAPLHDFYEHRLTAEQFLAYKPDVLRYIEQSGCIEYAQIVVGLLKDQAETALAAIDGDCFWKSELRKVTLGALA